MRVLLLCAVCGLLAGCGADGAPLTPTDPKYSATLGVGSSGVRTGANVSFGLGKVRIGIGRGL
ncbi:argininosuccinate lyase [Algirhabdus cladophorae]|uniref:argininosuccinate lyase n=1 Tax=Algirhabdus cladophorae TaxID=3377108 RepID=UPI003B846979